MNAEELFLTHLSLIERIAAHVCHRNRFDANEVEEFTSHVKYKLIEGNYNIVRKFENRSTFSTYMTTVITRMFFQYRVSLWGKWRPSAEAKRLGQKGITLERMLTRDGHTLEEATAILTTGSGGYSRAEVDVLYSRLPVRHPRMVLVAAPVLPEMPTAERDPDDALTRRERQRIAKAICDTIDGSIGRFCDEDQVILRMRFANSRKVSEIARILGLEQKKVYKRIDRMLAKLRKELERARISKESIDELLAAGDEELVVAKIDAGKTDSGHTHHADGGFESKGRLPG